MDGQFQYPAIAGDLDSRWRFKGASRGRGPRATLDWYSGTCLHALGQAQWATEWMVAEFLSNPTY